MGSKKLNISKEKSQIFLDSHCQPISVDNSQYEAEIGLYIEKLSGDKHAKNSFETDFLMIRTSLQRWWVKALLEM